jgi:hypothetical protein
MYVRRIVVSLVVRLPKLFPRGDGAAQMKFTLASSPRLRFPRNGFNKFLCAILAAAQFPLTAHSA